MQRSSTPRARLQHRSALRSGRARQRNAAHARPPNNGPPRARLCHTLQEWLMHEYIRPGARDKLRTQSPRHNGPQRRKESRRTLDNRPKRGIRPSPACHDEEDPPKKKVQGTSNRQKVGQFVNECWIETGRLPTWREIQTETGFSRATVARHVAALKEADEWPES